MTRWALLLEYDGTGVSGWQRQAGGPTFQAILEEAASRLTGGAPVVSAAAGRTDAGVHASGQVAMLDLPDRYGADAVRDSLNFHMRPHAIAVLDAVQPPPDWHPRFSARDRAYAFRILNRRARPVLDRHRVWHVERPLDAERMGEAARLLLGRHDFTSFRATACQAKSPVRTLSQLAVRRIGDMVVVEAEAPSFLHHQVRNLVGTLRLVGEGRWPVHRVQQALEARDRAAAGPTAPPDGLVLVRVGYETELFSSRRS